VKIEKLGSALVVVLALAGITAGSALAAATETTGHWKVGGTALATGESRDVLCATDTETSSNFKLIGKVAGSAVEVEASGIECPEASIFQAEEGGHGYARDSGKLKFTGLKVNTPAACSTSATLTTNPLTSQIMMEGTKVYDRFKPSSGMTIVVVAISGCAANGNYALKGTLFGLATHVANGFHVANATNEERAAQTLEFSGGINSTAGGTLTLGTEPAELTGALLSSLEVGSNFGVVE